MTKSKLLATSFRNLYTVSELPIEKVSQLRPTWYTKEMKNPLSRISEATSVVKVQHNTNYRSCRGQTAIALGGTAIHREQQKINTERFFSSIFYITVTKDSHLAAGLSL